MPDFWTFCYLNIPCLRINITLIFMSSSSNEFTDISRKPQKEMFLLVSGAIFVPLKGTPTWRLIQSLINLGKPFFRISHICNIAQTWFLARLFVYLSSFISQILDFLYWLVCIFIFDGMTVKTENSITNQYMLWCWQNLDQTNPCYPKPIFLSFRELQG